jgi:hypothetical protein
MTDKTNRAIHVLDNLLRARLRSMHLQSGVLALATAIDDTAVRLGFGVQVPTGRHAEQQEDEGAQTQAQNADGGHRQP